MSNPIVVGWDGTERGRDALALGAVLAREHGSRIVAIHTHDVPPVLYPLGDYAAKLRADAEREIEKLEGEAPEGVRFEARRVPAGSPAGGLKTVAERENAEVVVLGSTHRGSIGRVYPGGVADHLLHSSPCAVALAPLGYASHPADRLRVVLVGFDGSDESRAALKSAAEWASPAEATVRIVGVAAGRGQTQVALSGATMAPAPLLDLREYLRRELRRARDELPSVLRADAQLQSGDPVARIVSEAEKGVDLLVMGSRSRGPLARVLLGSVSSAVIREAPCPVMVVPRSVATRSAGEEAGPAQPDALPGPTYFV